MLSELLHNHYNEAVLNGVLRNACAEKIPVEPDPDNAGEGI